MKHWCIFILLIGGFKASIGQSLQLIPELGLSTNFYKADPSSFPSLYLRETRSNGQQTYLGLKLAYSFKNEHELRLGLSNASYQSGLNYWFYDTTGASNGSFEDWDQLSDTSKALHSLTTKGGIQRSISLISVVAEYAVPFASWNIKKPCFVRHSGDYWFKNRFFFTIGLAYNYSSVLNQYSPSIGEQPSIKSHIEVLNPHQLSVRLGLDWGVYTASHKRRLLFSVIYNLGLQNAMVTEYSISNKTHINYGTHYFKTVSKGTSLTFKLGIPIGIQ